MDLIEGHMLAGHLYGNPGNKPLFGFCKRQALEHPAYLQELEIALGECTRVEDEKGAMMCRWAGADPHVRAMHPSYDRDDDDREDWSTAIEWAVFCDHLAISA